jgi:hypothetical protein
MLYICVVKVTAELTILLEPSSRGTLLELDLWLLGPLLLKFTC